MKKKTIDLSDIKESELDKTSSFSDLMSRSERKSYLKEKENFNNIENMVNEKKKEPIKQIKTQKNIKTEADNPVLELTRSMKFNFDEVKEENTKEKKKGISKLNVIGEVNLLCIGYYIYLLALTNYQDIKDNYVINGGLIILLVLFFGMSVVTNKKTRKLFMFINTLAILTFIVFNAYLILN